jgi:hypothetical protein
MNNHSYFYNSFKLYLCQEIQCIFYNSLLRYEGQVVLFKKKKRS